MKAMSIKKFFFKTYEIELLKYGHGRNSHIGIVVYQENFQTMIGSKDGKTPFDDIIQTRFRFRFQVMKYIKQEILKELKQREESK